MGLVKNYIDPAFGSMQAAKLDAELLETFYARLRKCRKLCDGKKGRATHDCVPLSNSSVRQIHAILRGALDRGVRWTYFAVNAAELGSPHGQRRAHQIHRPPRKSRQSSTRPGAIRTGACCAGSSWLPDAGAGS